MSVKWVKHDNYSIVSEDGCYSIARIGGQAGQCFEVYRTRKHPDGVHLVAHNIADAKEARRLAEADARE